ncbi:MAG: hypothetical protein HY228_02380 [Candidatus Yonathbacteria bacterium]|nr:hypothetical protein [Candidatus Yonathbacteria bacterium]
MTDGVVANLLLQGVMVIAFVPTAVGIYDGRAKEKPFPWVLAVASYVLMTATIVIGWQGNWEALVHPLASGIGVNGALMVLAFRQQRRQVPLWLFTTWGLFYFGFANSLFLC